jgi:guanylate kinase
MCEKNSQAGLLFVVAGPSGTGKSSLLRALLLQDPTLSLSMSYTTRPPRGQEKDGVDYQFVSQAGFDGMVANAELVEWAKVHGYCYGTGRKQLQAQMQAGDVVLEIDYQGAFQIKQAFAQAVLIFILPPSLEALENRLRKRAEDTEEKIQLRLQNAKTEIQKASAFEFIVVNAVFEEALLDLQAIVRANRLKSAAKGSISLFRSLGIAGY